VKTDPSGSAKGWKFLVSFKTFFIPEVKAVGECGDHSSPSSAKIKNDGAALLLLHIYLQPLLGNGNTFKRLSWFCSDL
jgi:hypothetical protein